MRILFLNPPNSPYTEKSLLIEPIDTLVLASYIESLGHTVSLLDMDVKKLSEKDLASRIPAGSTDVAVIVFDYHIPLHTTEAFMSLIAIAKELKKLGSKVIVGGKYASYMPQKLIFEGSPVDIAIANDMEIPLSCLLQKKIWSASDLKNIPGISYRSKNKLMVNPPGTEKLDLNLLPTCNRNLVDLSDYIDVRTILSSRGCFMKCSFCHVPGFWKNWRGKSAENVVNEIEHLVKKHGAKKILFLDDNATASPARMKAISRLIISRNLQVHLGCLGTIFSFHRETMKLMFRAGFRWIHYGIESGDDDMLHSIHKQTSVRQIKSVITETKAMGFRVRTSWILDLPGTTSAALRNTITLIKELKTDEVRLHFLSLRMGSEYYTEYGSDELTQQYIHKGSQNIQLTSVSPRELSTKVKSLLAYLKKKRYAVIKNPSEFADLKALKKRSADMKIVSLCPLRYGLNWEVPVKKVIGIAGPMGAGKSELAKALQKVSPKTGQNFTWIEVDSIRRSILSSRNKDSAQAQKKLAEALGLKVSEGKLDLAELRRKIFSSPSCMKLYKSIMNPILFARVKKRIEELDEGLFAIEWIHLKEDGLESLVNAGVIYVSCSLQERRRRLAGGDIEESEREQRLRLISKVPKNTIRKINTSSGIAVNPELLFHELSL